MLDTRSDRDNRRILRLLRFRKCGHTGDGEAGPALRCTRWKRAVRIEPRFARGVIDSAGARVAPLAPAAERLHERASGAADLDRLELLEHRLRNGLEKARCLGRQELTVAPAFLGVREEQLPLRARDTDVKETSLLLQHGRIIERLGERKQSVLEAGDEHHRKLEPLRVVECHHRHRLGVGTKLVELRDEHRLLEKVVERGEPDLALLIGDQLRRAGDEFLHVLDAVRAFGSLGPQVFVVANALDDFPQQLVDARLARRVAKPRQQRRKFAEGGARGRTNARDQVGANGRRQHGHAGLARHTRELLNGGVTETALRHGDGAPKRLVVRRIGDQLQIAHEIANLSSIVEAHRADESIRYRLLSERLLERATLRIRPIHDREIAQPPLALPAALEDSLDHVVRLIALVEAARGRHALAAPSGRTQRLPHAAGVGTDHHVGEVEYLGRAAIILLETHDVRVRKVLLEVEDVANVGAAPAVDRLIVIAHDAEIAVPAREMPDEHVLRAIGILILVDEDVLEPALVLLEFARIVAEQLHGEQQQVIEVDGVPAAELLPVFGIDVRDGLREGIHREGRVLGRQHERVLRIGNGAVHAARRELLRVEAEALHDALHHRLRIILIIDREGRRAPDEMWRGAQHAGANGVECPDPHAHGRPPEQPTDPLLHLARGLVGERHRQDLAGVDAVVVDDARESRREHPRLP